MKFKIGDKVKVKWARMSTSAALYNGKIGIVLKCHSKEVNSDGRGNYYSLDIDLRHGGIWEQELELVDRIKKEIKVYGIVKFCKEVYR